ncbi:MAG: helix-turn-helix domain-containing protein [Acidimicrobiales bacterium]
MENQAPAPIKTASEPASGTALETASQTNVSDGYGAIRDAYPPMLNTSQVAELLDLNARTVLNMAGDGRLPASRLPGSRKFHFLLEDVISTLKANRIST